MRRWLENPLLVWFVGWVLFIVAMALIGTGLKARADGQPAPYADVDQFAD